MTAQELFQEGRLADAAAAALQQVKARPADVAARSFLCELLCYTGDLERADKHLDAIVDVESGAMMGVSLFRQLIRAETARRQFYEEGRPPEVVTEPSPEMRLRLEASVYLRDGDPLAAERLAEAEALRKEVRGTCDGTPFEGIRDLDDLLGSVLEVLTVSGKYYWIEWDRILSLEPQPIGHARDMLWRAANIMVRGGPEGEVYLPALYAGSFKSDDEHNRLGRATEWLTGPGGVTRGSGQKMLLLGDNAVPLLQLGAVETEETD